MILLDTHVLLWMGFAPERLSRPAAEAIAAARVGGGVGIAAITLWEIAWLASRGRISLNEPTRVWLAGVPERASVQALTAAVALAAAELGAEFPNDPCDRLIAGTALALGAPLVTSDIAIRRSRRLTTIW